MKKHLMIISCSDKKDTQPDLLPAIQRYKGAWYGVINKLKREGNLPDNLDILIISAKYGLINSETQIENYDQKMDYSRARELNEPILSKLENTISRTSYERILINLGSTYMAAISGLEKMVPNTTKMQLLKGRIGERKRDMKEWILSIR